MPSGKAERSERGLSLVAVRHRSATGGVVTESHPRERGLPSERRYGRWKVSANSTNLGSRRLAGVALLGLLEDRGWVVPRRL